MEVSGLFYQIVCSNVAKCAWFFILSDQSKSGGNSAVIIPFVQVLSPMYATELWDLTLLHANTKGADRHCYSLYAKYGI